jgi:putative phosphoesterase
MRIAVLADIHGNLAALEAVLAELDAEPVDAIVMAGDLMGGPQVRQAYDTLRARPERIVWISGNSERETVAAFDGEPPTDAPPSVAAHWSAGQLDRAARDDLASWPIAAELDGIVFCHGSPRSDSEFLTRATPEDVLADALGEGGERRVVVGGHTHQQTIRPAGGLTYVNAGSIGFPYEGRAAAFWAVLDDGVPSLRETAYDVAAAAEVMRATGDPLADYMLGNALLDPVDPAYVTALFEHYGGRGEPPGDPPPR